MSHPSQLAGPGSAGRPTSAAPQQWSQVAVQQRVCRRRRRRARPSPGRHGPLSRAAVRNVGIVAAPASGAEANLLEEPHVVVSASSAVRHAAIVTAPLCHGRPSVNTLLASHPRHLPARRRLRDDFTNPPAIRQVLAVKRMYTFCSNRVSHEQAARPPYPRFLPFRTLDARSGRNHDEVSYKMAVRLSNVHQHALLTRSLTDAAAMTKT